MKQFNLFFEGATSRYFDQQKDLYIGDKDFIFGNNKISIAAEIKTISKNYNFTGNKLTFNQAREYASKVNLIDHLKRQTKCYLFEYHKWNSNPYIIAVPFKSFVGTEKQAHEFLNFNKAKMLYLHKDNQFHKFLLGNNSVGMYPKKRLLCVKF